MKRKGSWYFEGYKGVEKLDANGKSHTELVYDGEWYGFREPGRQTWLKRRVGALSAVFAAAYLYTSLTPAGGGMWRWVGAPEVLTLLPAIFLVMALLNFLPAREKWEIRVYYAGYRRLGRSAAAILALQALTLAAELVYLGLHPGELGAEVHSLLGLLVSTGCAGALVLLRRKYPAEVVQGPKHE